MVYIIHAATDGALAAVLKSELERLIPGLRVFVASKPGDIPTGVDWLNEIQTNLREAKTFIVLLTPRSVERLWVWYESGAAWMSGQRTLPVVAGGLDAGTIPYPLGAAQALRLDDPGHAEQLFGDLGCVLDDPVAFVRRIREAEDIALQAVEEADGWGGLRHEAGFFAWKGPLAGLEDRDGVPPPRGLLAALGTAGMTPSWGTVDRLEHAFEKGRMQVFQTNQRIWKRPVISPNGILLVHVEDNTAAVLRALDGELAFNATVAEQAGTDKLGTEFSLDELQRMLTTGTAERFGADFHGALLRARGAMDKANRGIEASMQYPKGSNAWANAINAASKAIVEARQPLAALRELVRHHLL